MISEALQKARDFESRQAPRIPDSRRPAFHATPAVGWMNDPNGFSVYQGEYHLFFQYHPYSNEWGPMHWGHVKSKDLIRWERVPAAMAPDQPYDTDGAYSGSAVELPDGRQLLMYTGRRMEGGEEIQVQCIAVGDGTDYEKYSQNPVLTGADLPEGGSIHDFRDPKIWREPDGAYYAAIGNRTGDGNGSVLLYRSQDALHWEFVRILDRDHDQYCGMWECPDYFPLDGKQVLVISPQEMKPIGLEFHAGNGVVCLIGEQDPVSKAFTRQHAQALDYGLDFYAPQTLLAPDGRRIMIAWMQNWNTVAAKPPQCQWFGQTTVPRELSIRDGRVFQTPVRELERYRGPRTVHENVSVSGAVRLPEIQGRVLDMTVTIRPGEGCRRFCIHLAEDGEFETLLRWRPEEETLELDRSRSGLPFDVVHTRTFPVRRRDGALKLRLVLDRFSLELFVNDGEQAASAVIYTPQEAGGITFESDGAAVIDVEKFDLIFD